MLIRKAILIISVIRSWPASVQSIEQRVLVTSLVLSRKIAGYPSKITRSIFFCGLLQAGNSGVLIEAAASYGGGICGECHPRK